MGSQKRATQMTQSPVFPHIRPGRTVISVSGEGALAFLHNLLTVDLAEMKPGDAAYGALLSPQGKILHDVFLHVEASRVLLDCASSQAEALLQKLAMYRLRSKLDIRIEAGLHVAVGQGGPDPRLAAMGLRGIVAGSDLPMGDAGQYESLRIANGVADSDADIGMGELFVHEANLDLLGAVSFSKGCYVGQEVVSRTHHRGSARSRILPLHVNGALPVKGTVITSGDQRIGEILSGQGDRALGLIRLDRLAEAQLPLMANGSEIVAARPEWMKA